MSRLPTVLLLLSALISPAWSAAGPDYHGMIEVDGEAAGCVLTPGPQVGPTVLTRISWGPEEKRPLRLRARFPLTESWKQITFSFTAARQDPLTIHLKGCEEDETGRTTGPGLYVCYDDLAVVGARLDNGGVEDAEHGRPRGWAVWQKDGYLPPRYRTKATDAHGGKAYVAVSLWSLFSVPVRATGAEPVTVTLWVKRQPNPSVVSGQVQDAAAAAVPGLVRIRAGEAWRPIDTTNVAVKKGTALDFSRFNEPGPAGRHGRVIRRPDGQLAFTAAPDRPVRFFCLNVANRLPAEQDIGAFAAACRRQGYNAARLHWLGAELAGRADADGQRLNPRGLDLYDRTWAELKKHGIYILVDIASYTEFDPLYGGRDLRYFLYSEAGARGLWTRLARDLLTHRNPYTGTTLAEDPSVLVVDAFNEQNIRVGSARGTRLPAGLTGAWREFLQRRYASVAAWRAAWGAPDPAPDAATFADVPIFVRDEIDRPGGRGGDARRFLFACEDEMYSFYEKTIREIGYAGLLHAHDYIASLRLYPIRSRMDVVAMHGYIHHPTDFNRPGSRVDQGSCLEDAAGSLRYMLGSRIAGLPLLFTEFNHVYWGKCRYEEGLVYGAYCALQDVSLASLTHNAVRLRGAPLAPFCGGHDPVQRASQVVTGLLYHDRRVDAAPHRVDVYVSRQEAVAIGNSALASDQTRIALLTGFAARVEGGPPAPQADLTLRIKGSSAVVNDIPGVSTVRDQFGGGMPGLVTELRRKGILAADNRTDPAAGIFASETGQILMDVPQARFVVRGRNVSGVCFRSLPAPLVVGDLRLESASVSAAITVAALDDATVAASGRLLLVLATDARNSGEAYDADNPAVLRAIGALPVLLRTGRFQLAIRRAAAAPALQAWTLALDGTRLEPVVIESNGGWLRLNLDTARLSKGPTPFIEFAAR